MSGSLAEILVVEDDDANRLLVRRALERNGYAVTDVADGPGALHAQSRATFDLIVLDIGLPGLDGTEVLRAIRRGGSTVPVLLLTAQDGERARVAGLDAGADDYVVKPYSVLELVARVRALLRRATPEPAPTEITLGPLHLDLAAGRATVGTTLVGLTPKEFELLAYLAANAGRSVKREALLHHVWGSTSDWQGPATVTEHVRRIRLKLRAAGSDELIETSRGFGYRIDAP
jgi:two-component system, OmpR family, phosphate regulon response regulator PhoB